MRVCGILVLVLTIITLMIYLNDAYTITATDLLGLDPKKIKISLFYESYCPFSVLFVLKQLLPVTLKYADNLDLDLIPFGHCQTRQEPNGQWDFQCQHGEQECYGNRVHACVIEQGRNKGNAKTVLTLSCLMNFNYKDAEIQQCFKKTNFSWERHQQCMTRDAINLELAYGKRTHENVPRVKYVPFLMFNNVYNHTLEDLATQNLEYVVCELLGNGKPLICPNFSVGNA